LTRGAVLPIGRGKAHQKCSRVGELAGSWSNAKDRRNPRNAGISSEKGGVRRERVFGGGLGGGILVCSSEKRAAGSAGTKGRTTVLNYTDAVGSPPKKKPRPKPHKLEPPFGTTKCFSATRRAPCRDDTRQKHPAPVRACPPLGARKKSLCKKRGFLPRGRLECSLLFFHPQRAGRSRR